MAKKRNSLRLRLHEEIRDAFLEQDYVLRCKITDYQYEMLRSVLSSDAEKFLQLLNMGVDPGFVTDKGETCLHIVSGMAPDDASLEILRTLVYFGTSLNAMDRFGQTALHHAARTSAQNVKILLEGGANMDLKDNSGRTVLMEACNNSPADALTIVQYLMDRGCNIYCSDEDGCTALHYVCKNKYQRSSVKAEITYKLLYAGLSANVSDKTGKMALCYELTGQVLQQRPSIHSRQMDDKDKFFVIRALIQGGSSYSVKNKVHQKSVTDNLNLCKGPIFSQLLLEFTPVLSMTALRSIRDCIIDKEDHPDLLNQLQILRNNVQSLKFICRISIRGLLKGKCFQKVDCLPIPRTLKSYLLLTE